MRLTRKFAPVPQMKQFAAKCQTNVTVYLHCEKFRGVIQASSSNPLKLLFL